MKFLNKYTYIIIGLIVFSGGFYCSYFIFPSLKLIKIIFVGLCVVFYGYLSVSLLYTEFTRKNIFKIILLVFAVGLIQILAENIEK